MFRMFRMFSKLFYVHKITSYSTILTPLLSSSQHWQCRGRRRCHQHHDTHAKLSILGPCHTCLVAHPGDAVIAARCGHAHAPRWGVLLHPGQQLCPQPGTDATLSERSTTDLATCERAGRNNHPNPTSTSLPWLHSLCSFYKAQNEAILVWERKWEQILPAVPG